MNTTQEYAKKMQDFMGSFPMDLSAVQDSFKSYAAFGEKMSKVALDAAEKSTEISSKWTLGTLNKIGSVATDKDEPTDYSKSQTEFASAQAESTAETLAAFAEVAKKVQMDTVDLMLTAGKDMSADVQKAAEKATRDTQAAVKKATTTAAK
jgi:hypothetical protein